MNTHVRIVFYSMYGHTYRMAEAEARGARQVEDATVDIYQVPELVPDEKLKQTGAKELKEEFAELPVAEPQDLVEPDAVLFGTPTRFGNMSAQMRNFLDRTGSLWENNELVGKVGSVFTSTATQHGGQETTLTSFHSTLFHLGMIIVGVPYTVTELTELDQVSGGTPYGATTMAALDGSRNPSENELSIARQQGEHVAEVAAELKKGRAS